MAAFTALVLRTKETKDGRKYDAAELFAYDQWWTTDIMCQRDIDMVKRMAESLKLELRDERFKNDY